jgi:3-methyladenine DNA glycosylase AlkD
MDIIKEIEQTLFTWKDEPYGQFQRKLLPTVPAERVIGVRTPALRKYAKELGKRQDVQQFLEHLPHTYFEEDQLHAFIISGIRDMDECVDELEKFLPYVDNWATCDQMSPKVFQKNRKQLLPHINAWIASEHPYTVRYGVGMLMQYFLDEDFQTEYADRVAAIRSGEYYVRMMVAWYFATALAKQYEQILPYIEERRLDAWTHNKAIQKAVESYRITPEQKDFLKTLKCNRS